MRVRGYLPSVTLLARAASSAIDALGLGGGRDYLDIFQDRVSNLADLLDYIEENMRAIATGWLLLFSSSSSAAISALSVLLMPFILASFCMRLRQLEVDAVYAAGYAALLLIWPFPEVMDRLVYPLAPLVIIYAGSGAQSLGRLFSRPLSDTISVIPLSALLVYVSLSGGSLAWRFVSAPPPPDIEAWRASRYWLSAATPDQAEGDVRARQAMVDMLRAIRELRA